MLKPTKVDHTKDHKGISVIQLIFKPDLSVMYDIMNSLNFLVNLVCFYLATFVFNSNFNFNTKLTKLDYTNGHKGISINQLNFKPAFNGN